MCTRKLIVPYLGVLAVTDTRSSDVKVLDSKSRRDYRLIGHEENLRQSENVNSMFLRKPRGGAQAVYTGDREVGRRSSLYRLEF